MSNDPKQREVWQLSSMFSLVNKIVNFLHTTTARARNSSRSLDIWKIAIEKKQKRRSVRQFVVCSFSSKDLLGVGLFVDNYWKNHQNFKRVGSFVFIPAALMMLIPQLNLPKLIFFSRFVFVLFWCETTLLILLIRQLQSLRILSPGLFFLNVD